MSYPDLIMSEEQATPSVPPSAPSLPPLESVEDEVGSIERPKKSPKFMAATDLHDVINILVQADKISPDEAVRRLNNMVAKGVLVIVPLIGTKRRA